MEFVHLKIRCSIFILLLCIFSSSSAFASHQEGHVGDDSDLFKLSIEELMEENANLKAEVKRLRKRLSGFGECPECGNMTTAFGTSGKCGECGAEIE